MTSEEETQATERGPKRDYIVRCACGAEYTPKARSEPSECYECGSSEIEVEPFPDGGASS